MSSIKMSISMDAQLLEYVQEVADCEGLSKSSVMSQMVRKSMDAGKQERKMVSVLTEIRDTLKQIENNTSA